MGTLDLTGFGPRGRSRRRLAAGLAALVLGVVACQHELPIEQAAPTPAEPQPYKVVEVLDGDTFDVQGPERVERIRVLGINTPEKWECKGDAATELTDSLVSPGVWLDADDRDHLDRVLAHAFSVDGEHVGLKLVSQGLALAAPYARNDDWTDDLAAAEAAARDGRLGMFAVAPCGGSASPSPEIRIVEIDGNPAGDDLATGAGESVLLVGPPDAPLAGWMLKDKTATHRYRFSDEARLDRRGHLRIYTSCGEARSPFGGLRRAAFKNAACGSYPQWARRRTWTWSRNGCAAPMLKRHAPSSTPSVGLPAAPRTSIRSLEGCRRFPSAGRGAPCPGLRLPTVSGSGPSTSPT